MDLATCSLRRGTLKIQTAGLYTFFLTSDDGSRLELDGVEVVLNGGFHGMEERIFANFRLVTWSSVH